MKHWKWIASTGLVAGLAIAYGIAGVAEDANTGKQRHRSGGPASLLETLDIDGDGEITRAELGQADQAFDTLDTNGDGVVSVADFPRRRHGRQMARVLGVRLANLADRDGSGEVTEAEWQAAVAAIETDADGNIVPESLRDALGIDPPSDAHRGPRPLGPITAEELKGLFGRLDEDDNGVLEGDELRWRRRGPGSHRGLQAPRPPALGALADADGSGSVTPEEWQNWFTELDRDGNGTLDADEWRPRHRGEARMRRGSRTK